MRHLIVAVLFGLLSIPGVSYAHCGSCGVGDESHQAQAMDGKGSGCTGCGCEKDAEPCTKACAEACAKDGNCDGCGGDGASKGCEKSPGG